MAAVGRAFGISGSLLSLLLGTLWRRVHKTCAKWRRGTIKPIRVSVFLQHTSNQRGVNKTTINSTCM